MWTSRCNGLVLILAVLGGFGGVLASRALAGANKATPVQLAADGGFSLWQHGEVRELRASNGVRLRLGKQLPEPKQEVNLPGGYRVRLLGGPDYSDVTLSRHGKTVDRLPVVPLRDRWLADDAIWGSRNRANAVRYAHVRGGVPFFFTDARQVGNGVWALLRLYREGASSHGQHIFLEVPVRIEIKPKLALCPLRPLRFVLPTEAGTAFHPALRTFQIQGRWYLHNPPQIHLLGEDATPRRVVATLPSSLWVSDVLGGQWLVLAPADPHKPQLLSMMDLASGKRTPVRIPGPWEKADETILSIPASGNRFRVTAHQMSDNSYQHFLISLPDRRVQPLQSHQYIDQEFFWRNWLVLVGAEAVEVLDARSGRRLAQMKLASP